MAAASRRLSLTTRRAAVAAAFVVVTGALLSGEIPHWTLSGTRMVAHEPLTPRGKFPLAIPAEGTVLVIGDSNSAGNRVGGAGNAYPAVFAARLGIEHRLRVEAFGGARARDLENRVTASDPIAFAVIMLGSNDAAVRGTLDSDRPIAPAEYKATLTEMARRLAESGAVVLILAPPPVGSSAMERRLADYRAEARLAARDANVAFFDPAAAFGDGAPEAVLQFDALHLNAEAQRVLGLWLAAQVFTR